MGHKAFGILSRAVFIETIFAYVALLLPWRQSK